MFDPESELGVVSPMRRRLFLLLAPLAGCWLSGCGLTLPDCPPPAVSLMLTTSFNATDDGIAAVRSLLEPYIENRICIESLPDAELLLFALDPSQTAVNLRMGPMLLTDALAVWNQMPTIPQTINAFRAEQSGIIRSFLPSAQLDSGSPIRELLTVSAGPGDAVLALIRSGGLRSPVYERYRFIYCNGWRCADVELFDAGRLLTEQLATLHPAFAGSARILVAAERSLADGDSAAFERLMKTALRDPLLAPAAHFIYGEYKLSGGEYEDARRCFTAVLRARPFHLRAWQRLGDVGIDRRRFSDAAQSFRTLADMTVDDPFYSSLCAMAAGMSGDAANADARFDAILSDRKSVV